ncbi:pentapeptide repeat-containing protein, partial [Escherichia coli]|uniref:pentapeptide repeat-containing protein n=2 Tax=Gammaproteobacteria TaxID=1236 RepID=UPI0028EA9C4B
DLEMTWLSKADLMRADLTDANLQEAKLNDANLADAVLTGARRHYATFQGTNMEGCKDCPHDWEK